ncbi:MAG TPA: hypothetical protein VGQ17_03075, partial [Gemmatimonadales bacterium]|nr:hypothetical protein [Gemmatimonadales bacterium]
MTFLHKLAHRLASCHVAVFALAFVLAGCGRDEQRDFLAPSSSTPSTAPSFSTTSTTSSYAGKLSINPRQGQVGRDVKLLLVGWSYLSSGDSTKPKVSWSTSSGSTISSGGLFRSTKTGIYMVKAVQSLSGGIRLRDSVKVVVGALPGEVITLDPVGPTISKGGSRRFAAKGILTDGTVMTPVVQWNATGGTVDTGGVYTAGITTGTFQLAATLDGSLTGATPVTVVSAVLT